MFSNASIEKALMILILLTASSRTEVTSDIRSCDRSEYLRSFFPMNQMNPKMTGRTINEKSVSFHEIIKRMDANEIIRVVSPTS